jgi:hypothetical protein
LGEGTKFRHPRDHRDLSPPDLNEIKFGARDRAGNFEGNCIRSAASDLLRPSFNMFAEFGGSSDAIRQTMSIGIPACPSPAGARARSCTLSRILPVCGDLSFSCHGQDAGFAAESFIRRTGI